MSAIGSISGLQNALLGKLQSAQPTEKLNAGELGNVLKGAQAGNTEQTQPAGFGKLFEGMIDAVDAKQRDANEITKKVLLGQGETLHNSVIAMQEASVAFSMMIEVRNKLVDSYQELMRMPV